MTAGRSRAGLLFGSLPRLLSRTALLLLCLSALLRAENAPPAPVPPAPPITVQATAPAVVHITDAQDRMGSGSLATDADHRARANALYAQAMLMPDGAATDQQKAASIYRQITTLDPAFLEAQVKLADILLQSGQLDQAEAQLQSAVALHPESIALEVALGYAQRLRGQNDEAFRLCAKAVTADPNQAVAMRVILEIAADQNDLAGGVLHIEDILKAGGAKVGPAPWLNLAHLYMEIAHSEIRPPESDVILNTRLPILLQAAAKSPPSSDTLTLLAETFLGLDRKSDALKTLRDAVEIDPSNVDLILRCADLESELEQKADALKDYERAYTLDPTLPNMRAMLGNLYLENHRYDDACRLFEEALADSPGNPTLEIDLGIAYEEAHHPDQAQTCFQIVFNSVDCPVEAYTKLAFYQLQHHEVKEAGATLTSARSHFPQSPNICYYQAVQHRLEKDYTDALASLDQVRTLTAASSGALDPAWYLESALTLNLIGDKKRLESTLQEGIRHYPDNAELMNELAYFWADAGDHLPEALALGRHAVEIDPDNGPIQDTCGWIYFQMGQVKDALPYLQRAAVLTNNDPVVLQHVGDAYLKIGMTREAIATWTRALEKDPHNGDLTSRIDAAQAQAKNAHSRSAPTP
jgi:tetratricopeptide (TPR) repeat protein